uniref:citrate/2-methylcitrate synthase n=1 Tax=Gemmiger sp. TaxID=2049027 RepID=UPI003A8E108A
MYYPDVPALEPDELNLLCNEYLEHNATLDPHLADQMGVKRGLRNLDGTGVLAGITNVSNVIGYDKRPDGTIAPIPGRLVYRGIDIDTLAAAADAHDRFMFEEVIWLLLFGSLPTQEQYAKFRKLLEHHRELPQGFADDMILNSPSPNLMNKIARSVLAMYSYDEHAEDNSLPNILRQSINLIAELPTMMVNAYQIKRRVYDRSSMYFHLPTEGQSTAEHILSTYRADQKFTHEEARLLDLCLLVHADHGGGNCSTFTCRVLSSSGTDTYAAISSAIGALKGPKHGGANLKVMHQLDYILENVEDPSNDDEVREFLRKILRKERGDGSG